MRFCKHCRMPVTRPDLEFDERGVCDAGVMAERKAGGVAQAIDWEARRKEFEILIERYRSPDPAGYDCIIPVSGGKDSTYQVHVAKSLYGLRRSEEHTSELQSLMRISYAVFCLKKKTIRENTIHIIYKLL